MPWPILDTIYTVNTFAQAKKPSNTAQMMSTACSAIGPVPKPLPQTCTEQCNTHVTTAFGFFSTAYTLILRPESCAALSNALTSGPRPAPTTITIL